MRHRVYRARAGCRTGGQPGTPRLHASRREGMPAGRISAGRKGKEAQTHPGPAEYPQGRDIFHFLCKILFLLKVFSNGTVLTGLGPVGNRVK